MKTTPKKELPPHLKALVAKMEAAQAEQAKVFGFTMTDRTPAGYGPQS